MADSTKLTIPDKRLDYVIHYMKLEDVVEAVPEEKDIVATLCMATMIYLQGAPVLETEENADLYWFLVGVMVLHAYDHRDEVGFVPPGVRPVFNQLKLQTDYAESE